MKLSWWVLYEFAKNGLALIGFLLVAVLAFAGVWHLLTTRMWSD